MQIYFCFLCIFTFDFCAFSLLTFAYFTFDFCGSQRTQRKQKYMVMIVPFLPSSQQGGDFAVRRFMCGMLLL